MRLSARSFRIVSVFFWAANLCLLLLSFDLLAAGQVNWACHRPGPDHRLRGSGADHLRAMTRDPNFMIPFMQAIASGEAPGRYPLSHAQWQQAFDWYSKGSPQGPAALSLNRMLEPTGGGGGVVAQSAPITLNAPITINGVPTGQAETVADRVSQAVKRSTGVVIDEIKRAQNSEARLGYI
jgi:hypothetical protein